LDVERASRYRRHIFIHSCLRFIMMKIWSQFVPLFARKQAAPASRSSDRELKGSLRVMRVDRNRSPMETPGENDLAIGCQHLLVAASGHCNARELRPDTLAELKGRRPRSAAALRAAIGVDRAGRTGRFGATSAAA
jgi:hypothetical protein